MSTDPTPKPTIEERLEAVVQTLELVAAMQRDHETAQRAELAAMQKQLTATDERWNQRLDKILTTVETLTQIAQSHERRLSGLEGQQQ